MQSLTPLLPAADVLPSSQAKQADGEVAPSTSEYLPASQSSQATFTPSKALYLPVSQLSQVVAASDAWYLPASHS